MSLEANRATPRLLISFLVDFVRIAGAVERSYDLGVIFMLVALANIETLTEDDIVNWAYSNGPIPEEMRRPISANAIALELGVPEETARRQIKTLVDRGALRRVGRTGVIASVDYLRRPEVAAAQSEITASFLQAVRRLIETGFQWPVDSANGARALALRQYPNQSIPTFLMSRQILALAIRLLQVTMQQIGRLEICLLYLATAEINLQTVTADPELSRRYSRLADPPPPDHLRVPATIAMIRERTNMSRATASRLVAEQIELGLFERRGKGVVIPREHRGQDEIFHLMRIAHNYFLSTANRLSDLGLRGEELRRWDAEYAARSGA